MSFKHITQETLAAMEDRARAHFINSLSGFKSANLIATKSQSGLCNLAMISSVVHLGAAPALVGFIMRPDNGERHTLANIIETNSYTINQVGSDFYRQAHQTSASYLKTQNEFDETNLTAHYLDEVHAPFVKQSQLKYAVKLKQIMPIELNGTQFVIGEITQILCQQTAMQPDGYIDIEALNTVCVSGLDAYHTTQDLSRLNYAKPGVETSEYQQDEHPKDRHQKPKDNL